MVRLDFSGGYTGDAENKFLASGRNKREQEAFEYVKKLANFRKSSSALQTGKIMQWLPKDGVYIYFRYNQQQTVLTIMNTSDKARAINLGDYAERTAGFNGSINILNNEKQGRLFSVEPGGSMVLLLQ